MRTTVFLLTFLSLTLYAQRPPSAAISRDEVRVRFYAAIEDQNEAEKLFTHLGSNLMSPVVSKDPVLKAYYGASETLLGKHYLNPYSKYKHLKNGLEVIGQSIKSESRNLEVRFLRFSILHYIPSFLGYSGEREEDLKVIYSGLLKKDYKSLSFDIQKGIIEFIIRSGRLSQKQIEAMNGLLLAG